MNFAAQKKLFISWRSVRVPDDGLLQPGVIPALGKLTAAGYRVVLIAVPKSQDAARVIHLLKMQGIDFDELLWDDAEAVSSSLGRSEREETPTWYAQAFGLIREDLWAKRLDRLRSGVVGIGAAERNLAEVLGLPFYPLTAAPAYSEQAELGDVAAWGLPWQELAKSLLSAKRQGKAARRTRETDIQIEVHLDGDPAASQIQTGIGYFDHMLDQLARHGGMALSVKVKGDVEIDDHHTVEDTGLDLGEALRQYFGDLRGVARYGFTLPMDETLATCALDLSGRPGLFFKGTFSREKVGELATEMVPHFFQSLAQTLGATIHITVDGINAHHQVEGVFKAVAKSFSAAIRTTGEGVIPSTKGVL